MTKNGKITIAVIIIAILAGVVYFVATTSDNVTTPPITGGTPPPTPGPTPSPASPAAPAVTGNSSVVVSNTAAVVTGSVNPRGAQTTYWFEYSTNQTITTSNASRTTAQMIGSGFATIPTPGFITSLKPNTLYYFRLGARNSIGTVYGATHGFTTSATTPAPQGSAPTVQTLAATEISGTGANIKGTVNPKNVPTTYWFEYGDTQNLGNTSNFESLTASQSASGVTFQLANVQAGTKYYYRLNAQNQYGTVNGSILNFTTTDSLVPGKPISNTESATGITSSAATLNGHITPHGASSTYWFEYGDTASLNTFSTTTAKSAGEGYSPIAAVGNIGGLTRETTYYFRVVAENKFGKVGGSIVSSKTNP